MNDSILASRAFRPLPLVRLVLFGLLMLTGNAVYAQSFTASISTVGTPPGSIGTVTTDSSGTTSTYKITASSGATDRTSGSALPTTATGTRALITVACSGHNKCTNGTNLTATIKIDSFGTPTGRALALTNFNVAAGSGTPTVTQVSSSSLTLTMSGTWNSAKTFHLGADFRVAGTGTTGTSEAQYLITATPGGSTSTGSFSANVRRPISMARDSHLAFGTVVRPSTGSNTIAIDATSGGRSIGGGGNGALRTSTTSRAQFTVTGESGQTFNITDVPATLTMTSSGGGSIPVTLVRSHNNPVSISGGSTSAAGTVTIGVGGSFTISSSTPAGAYSATFPITVTYN